MALSVAEEIEMLELELEMEDSPQAQPQAQAQPQTVDYGFGETATAPQDMPQTAPVNTDTRAPMGDLEEAIRSPGDAAQSVAGGFNKGMIDLANLVPTVAGLPARGLAAAMGREQPKTYDLYDIPGVESLTAPVEGDNIINEMLYTGTEWGGSGILGGLRNATLKALPGQRIKEITKGPGFMGGAKNPTDSLMASEKITPPAPLDFLPSLVKTKAAPQSSIAPDLIMGSGAAIGEQVGGEPGELIGGLLGLGGALTGKKLGSVEKISDITKNAINSITPGGGMFGPSTRPRVADRKAVDFLQDRMANTNEGMGNLNTALARGEKGTLADLSQDAGLYDVEKAARTSYAGDDIIKRQIAERNAQNLGEVEAPFGAADSGPSMAEARRALKQDKAKIQEGEEAVSRGIEKQAEAGLAQTIAAQRVAEKKANAAAQLADEAELGIAPQQKTAQSSRALKEGFDTLETTEKELIKPIWDEFEGGSPIEITELQKTIKDNIEKLPPEMADDLSDSYNNTIKQIGNWKGEADPKSVQYVLSSIKDSLNTAKSTGNFGVLEKELGNVGRVIEESLTNPLNRTEFKNAIEASKEMYRKTGANTKVGKARLREDAETFGNRLDFSGDAGASTGRIIQDSGDPEIIRQAEDFLKGKAKTEGLDEAFMTKYDQVLDYFPELKSKMKKVSESKLGKTQAKEFFEETVKTEGKKGEVLTKAKQKQLDEVQKRKEKLTGNLDERVLGQYANNPDKTIDRILKDKNDVVKEGDLKELYRNIKLGGADPGPFKTKVKERMLDIIAPKKGGMRQTKEQSIDSYDKIKDTLVESGVITQKESDAISTALEKGDKAGAMRAAAKIRASDTASEAMKLFASGTAATALGLTNSSNQLAMMAALRRNILRKLEGKPNQEALNRMDEFIANPESFRDLANEVSKMKDIDQAADKFVTRAMATGQVGAAENE